MRGAMRMTWRRSAGSFVLRRMGSSRLLLGSILVAVLAASGVTAALVSFSVRTLPAAAQRQLLRAGPPSVTFDGQLTPAQASAAGHAISASVRAAFGTVPVTVNSARWSDPLSLPGAASRGLQLQAAALGGITASASLAGGAWPGPPQRGQPIPVAVPAPTARVLRLTPGRLLIVHDGYSGVTVRLRVSGTYRQRRQAAPYWAATIRLRDVSGSPQDAVLSPDPLIVSPAAFGPGHLPVILASWVALPHLAEVSPDRYAGLAAGLQAMQARLQDPGQFTGLAVTTSLPQVLADTGRSLAVARSLLLVGALQLLLLAAAAIALCARLLAGQREAESALLAARGMARRQLARRAIAEAVVLAAGPAVAGAIAGSALAGLAAGARPAGRALVPASAWWAAAMIITGCVSAMVWPVLSPADPAAADVRRGRPLSLAGTARAGADVALIALAAIALWQLRLYSAASRSATGSLGVYPVLAIAPALALAGATLIPLRVLPAVARVLDALTGHTRRLGAALASWQISRSPVRQAGPALLVVLAVATGTIALAQHDSWHQSAEDQASFGAGADTRVDLAAPLSLGQLGEVTRAPGVTAAMPVARLAYAGGAATILAVDSGLAAATVLLRPDFAALPATSLWRAIRSPGQASGLMLPGRPARLQISAQLRPAAAERGLVLAASVSVQDADGIVYSVPAGLLTAGRPQLVAPLSGAAAGGYPLRLLGISMSYNLPGRARPGQLGLTITSMSDSAAAAGPFPAPFAAGRALRRWGTGLTVPGADLGSRGLVQPVQSRPAAITGGGLSLAFAPGGGMLRAGSILVPVPARLTLSAPVSTATIRAIATSAFLAARHLTVGDITSFSAGSTSIDAVIVAAVRQFPTISSARGGALIVDQAALQDQLLAHSAPPLPVTEWWLRTASGRTPPGLPAGAVVTSRAAVAATVLASPLNQSQQLALLAVAVAAALLAALGFAASVAASMRERRTQGALLAALGVNRAGQARQLCLEQLMLSTPAAAVGLLLGAGIARLLVPAVTLTALGLPPVPAVLVQVPLGWAAILAAAVTAVPVLAAAATVARRPDPAAQLRAAAAL
jgi:hypothetical protein